MSATFAEKGVYEPEFAVGDTVWIIKSKRVEVSHPCPDCQGTKLWKATSPAGVEHEIDCPRCGGGSYSRISGVHVSDIPPLKYAKTVYAPEEQKIAGIEIREHAWNGETPDNYRMDGSSGTYNRKLIYRTIAEAQSVANIKNAEEDAKNSERPDVLAAAKFKDITIRDAAVQQLKDSLWESWYAFRNLQEEGETLLNDDEPYNGWSRDERVNWFKEHELGRRNPYIDYGPVFGFMDIVAEKIAAGGADPDIVEKFNALDTLFMTGTTRQSKDAS